MSWGVSGLIRLKIFDLSVQTSCEDPMVSKQEMIVTVATKTEGKFQGY